MSGELNLVADLALILVSAGIATVLCKALKQPLILGYLVVGFLVGPHFGIFPNVTNTESVKQWSDIGIIFLLFALGLEFSFKKLLKVGSSALITAGTTCIGMMIVGISVGSALRWSSMECVFLGGMLAMSSTTIIIKVYDDLGYKNKPYAPLVFGTLVLEDLIAVLMMVLLSTLAVSQKFEGREMLFNLCKLGFFLILWFLIGIWLIPTLFQKAKKYLDDEILMIVALGLCFLMVTLAESVGFSSALGAFVMGSILSETLEGEKISKLIHPVKDLFGAIFFVSVGMMVDPAVIGQYWGTILILAVTNMLGILILATSGSLMTRQGLDNSVHTGFSLAQLGEFAFIIAGLGVSLGVVRDFIYPVVVSVSVLTTFTTPYMMKAGTPVSDFLHRKLPARWLEALNPTPEQKKTSVAEENDWISLIERQGVRVVLYSVILIAIQIICVFCIKKYHNVWMPDIQEFWKKLFELAGMLGLMSPFLFGLAISRGNSVSALAHSLVQQKPSNRWPLFGLTMIRALVAMGFVLLTISYFFKLATWLFLLILLVGIVAIVIARFTVKGVSVFEKRFIENLNAKDAMKRKLAPVTTSVNESLAKYDVHTEIVEITSDSRFAGMTLRSLPFRHTTGVNIVKIDRASGSVLIPTGSEMIFPGDRLIAVGTSDQLRQYLEVMSTQKKAQPVQSPEFGLIHFVIGEDSYLNGKVLRATSMRSSGCMVISVLRGDDFISNPEPEFRFKEGDIVWLAGDKESCEWYK